MCNSLDSVELPEAVYAVVCAVSFDEPGPVPLAIILVFVVEEWLCLSVGLAVCWIWGGNEGGEEGQLSEQQKWDWMKAHNAVEGGKPLDRPALISTPGAPLNTCDDTAGMIAIALWRGGKDHHHEHSMPAEDTSGRSRVEHPIDGDAHTHTLASPTQSQTPWQTLHARGELIPPPLTVKSPEQES